MTKKLWFARVALSAKDYGRWIPTGCADKQAALDYMDEYLQDVGIVKEWMLV